MMTSSARAPARWSLPPGARVLALEDLDCLVFAKRDAPAPASGTARTLSTLASVASDGSVFFLNEANRIEALVDVSRSQQLQLEDFSTISSLMMAPGVSHRVGKWTRERRWSDGFWSVVFEDAEATDYSLRKTLEEQILIPWINNERVQSYFYGQEHRDLWESEAELHASFARHSEQLNRMVTAASSNAWVRFDWNQLAKALATNISHLTDVQDEMAHVLRDKPSQSDAKEPRALAEVITKIEKATQAVDELSKSLSSVATEVDASGASAAASKATAPDADPIRNAIEIREQLTRSVKMVDAATWAQWRGASSKNPSAALGKYKNQARLFAVRTGNRDLYPAFQFSENGEPLPIIEEVLKAVPGEAQGWSLLSWFEAKNVLLRGRKPSALLSSEPRAVLEAAERFYSRDD